MKALVVTIYIFIILSSSQLTYSITDSTTLNSTNITSSIILHKSTSYLMKGFNYVKSGAAISIEAGTKIFGDFNSKGTLIIERGAKIYANGNVNDPIVFTSK